MANTKLPARLLDTSAIPALNVTGDLTVDTTTLKVDSTNNRVGIGDSTPQALLDVGGGYGGNTSVATFAHSTDAYIEIENMTTQNGAGIILTNAGTKKWTIQKDTSAHGLYIQDASTNANMTFLQGGNVGINQTTPAAKLDIKGDTTTYAGMSKIYLTDTASNSDSRNWAIGNGGSGFGHFTIGRSVSKNGDPMASGTHTTPFVIDHEDNVGIGITSPESKLAVKGSSGNADLFSISDVAVPTSGGEYGVAMIKTNSTEYALNITSYNANGKGLRVYNNGGQDAFLISQAGGDRLVVDGSGKVAVGHANPYAQFSVYRSGSDPYSPTSFLDYPTMELKGDNVSGGYVGTRITNAAGNYEWFSGVNQDGSNHADFVFQGYNRSGATYQEMARLHDAGVWNVPKQPHWMGSITNTTGTGLANSATAQYSRNTINYITQSGYIRFVAPIGGIYLITFTAIADNGTGRVDSSIYVNGNTVSSQLSSNGGSGYRQRTAAMTVNLSKDDQVTVHHADWYASTGTGYEIWRTFSMTMIA